MSTDGTTPEKRPSLRDLDAHADRDGGDLGQDNPLDPGAGLGVPSRTQGQSNSGREAETGRGIVGSGVTGAQTPPETLARIGDARTDRDGGKAARDEALDRATASLGQDD